MAHVTRRVVEGRTYLYAERSVRLRSGSVRKVSVRINEPEEASSGIVQSALLSGEVKLRNEEALKIYGTDKIFTADVLSYAETARVEYRELMKRLTAQQRKDVLDRFTANFTYESNAIEGNSLTLKDVTLILKENIVPAGRDLREVYETRNTREVNEKLFTHRIKLSVQGIVRVHAALVKDTGIASGFKRLPNYLFMRDLSTTPPEKVEDETTTLLDWYRSAANTIHPLRLAARFHERFERIHPFEDGNGRVGRVLLNAILLEHRYPPLIIRKTMRQSYFSALHAADHGRWDKLERFIIETHKATFEKFFKVYVKYL